MIDPLIGVIFERDLHPSAKALSDLLDPQMLAKVLCDERLPLSEALTREWEQDAHFCLYSLVDETGDFIFARAKKRGATLVQEIIARGGSLQVLVLVFDYDLPGHGEWTPYALEAFLVQLGEASLPEPTYWYTTLHGCRFVYVLTRPVSHLQAEAMMRSMVEQFKLAGIELDTQCTDWTRLFRLPKTVRPDAPTPFHEGPFFMFLASEKILDPDVIHASTVPVEQPAVVVQAYASTRPDADEVRAVLTKQGDNGKTYDSDWVKAARKMLQGRQAFAICFEHSKIDVADGWNNGVLKLVGQVIGMTAREETASPERIYALIFAALEQLQADEDEKAGGTNWFDKSWDMVCRMWTNEQSQILAEQQARELILMQAQEVRGSILDKLRQERPSEVPANPEEADRWFRQRMIGSDGRQHYVMRRDGTYNVKSISDSMLVPMIRELQMEDVIQTHEMRGKVWAPRSSQAILNDHATPVIRVKCSSRDGVAFIDGDPGYRELHIPVHRLNQKVKPLYNRNVEAWLRTLAGESYEHLKDWLAWSLEVGGPICALNLFGSPGSGKGMLVQGLAECFEGEHLNDSRVLAHRFNTGLLYSPLVWCDEGVPKLSAEGSVTIDQAFRTLVTGGNLVIEGKGTNPINADIYPRIIFTSNDRDILRSILGSRDLTEDDVKAIEIRLLSIEVSAKARTYLTGLGNYSYTSGWIAGREPSQYILASHIRHLHASRNPVRSGSGRLLVEGEIDTELVRSLRLRNASSQIVLRSLLKMVESPQARAGLYVKDNSVWITPSGLVDYAESSQTGEEITLPRAAQVLRQFSAAPLGMHVEKSRPGSAPRGRWIELDLGMLYEEALRYGMPCNRLEQIVFGNESWRDKAEKLREIYGGVA